MPILLDTSAVNLLMRRHREAELLTLRYFPPVICVHVIGEILYGPLNSGAPESKYREAYEFLRPFEMLKSDMRTAETYARVRADLKARGVVISDPDYWIAAHALDGHLPLLTSDRDFLRIPELRLHCITH